MLMKWAGREEKGLRGSFTALVNLLDPFLFSSLLFSWALESLKGNSDVQVQNKNIATKVVMVYWLETWS